MSHLKVFPPVADALPGPPGHSATADPTAVTPEQLSVSRHWLDAVDRARVIYVNRTCQHCRRTTVVPLELQDAFLNRNLMPIPGTATLVGFRCCSCGSEWVADD